MTKMFWEVSNVHGVVYFCLVGWLFFFVLFYYYLLMVYLTGDPLKLFKAVLAINKRRKPMR